MRERAKERERGGRGGGGGKVEAVKWRRRGLVTEELTIQSRHNKGDARRPLSEAIVGHLQECLAAFIVHLWRRV